MNKVAIILSTWGSWIWLKTLGRLGKKKKSSDNVRRAECRDD